MSKETRINKREELLISGLKHLRATVNMPGIDDFTVQILETLMLLDRDDYLQKLSNNNKYDKGNGHYTRHLSSFAKNSLVINIPRTRSGKFKTIALEFLKYTSDRINELVLTLYSKGLTTRDISDILADFFGENMSYAQVSNLASKFHDMRMAWESSKLESYYKVIYYDAIYISVRRGESYTTEPVYIMFGIRKDNKRELLSLEINPTESAEMCGKYLKELKQRGIKHVDLIVADGLTGLEKYIHLHFPKAEFQKCVVHKMRNILKRVRPKEKKEVAEDLKHVFNNFSESSSIENAIEKTITFIDKWKGLYPNLLKQLNAEEMHYYFTYINFPCEIRRMIYTSNSVESLNKKLRKATKNKQSFEKPERLLDYLFIIIKDFEQKNWMKYPVSNFGSWKSSETHFV